MVFVADLALLLKTTHKAVRYLAAMGQLPKPFRLGKRLAWLGETIRTWLLDRSRSAGKPPVQITLATHHYKGTTGLQAIWKMQLQGREVKTSELVPSGQDFDRAQAKLWAVEQVERIVPKLMAKAGLSSSTAVDVPTRKADPAPQHFTNPKSSVLFKDFVRDRFEPEHVASLKESTQDVWHRMFRDHLLPFFGNLPLGAIDEDQLSRFRGRIMKYTPGFKNGLIGKLKKVLRFALGLRVIDRMPLSERFIEPKIPVTTYTPQELDRFLMAGAELSPVHHLMALIVADLGLRAGEVCGLKWADVDLRTGEILIISNASKGSGGTPKGTIARVAMSAALHKAMEAHKRREPIGPLVLYHWGRTGKGGPKRWTPFNQPSLWRELTQVSKRAGLGEACSARFMRHCMITSVHDHGGTSAEVQAHARHALLSTTERYLHPRQAPASRRAMSHLDNAREERENPAGTKTRSKKSKTAPA